MYPLTIPFRQTFVGISYFPKGLRWLKKHPRYLFLLILPIFMGLAFFALGWLVFSYFYQDLLDFFLFAKPEVWYGIVAYYVLSSFLYVVLFVLVILSSILLTNIVASPFYEIVSIAVEKDITGKNPPDMYWRDSLRLILEELKKVCFIFFITSLLVFIPGVNVISIVLIAAFVGWDFFDYPLSRHGWGFRRRLNEFRRHFWEVMGLGLWLMLPFVQIIFMPLAIVGGTMLGVDIMKEDHQLKESL